MTSVPAAGDRLSKLIVLRSMRIYWKMDCAVMLKGAFPDAANPRIGCFEAACGGTIFLDEVGDIPPPTQIKLLRTLEEMEIERVGAHHPIKIDVRIVSATHKNLEELIAQGRFREDLGHPALQEKFSLDRVTDAYRFLYGRRLFGRRAHFRLFKPVGCFQTDLHQHQHHRDLDQHAHHGGQGGARR